MKRIVRVLWGMVYMSSLSLYSQNAPISVAPVIVTEPGTTIEVPVLVYNFNGIGAASLTLNYDSSVLVFQSASVNPAFPELLIPTPLPGKVVIGGFGSSDSGVLLPDSSALFTLTFSFLGGTSGLNWYDNGSSCEFSGPSPSYTILNDAPQETYYINGSVSAFPIPGPAGMITGPSGGNVCAGQSGVIFSVEPIINATDYVWTVPMGAAITAGNNTNEITVSFSSDASDGSVSVYGYNQYGFGPFSPPFPIVVNFPPSVISQPVSPETVNAGSGIAVFNVTATGSGITYQWQEYNSTWLSINDSSFYSGAETESLVITNPTLSMNGNKYRCIITGSCEPSAFTDGNATLAVQEILGIRKQQVEKDKQVFTVFPNPCINTATFGYYLPEDCEVEIEIRSMDGKLVKTIPFYFQSEGFNEKKVEIEQLNAGIYYATMHCRSNTNFATSTVKLVLNK
jgi:hypothetical protein